MMQILVLIAEKEIRNKNNEKINLYTGNSNNID